MFNKRVNLSRQFRHASLPLTIVASKPLIEDIYMQKKDYIDYLKAFAIILVVTHHAIEYANVHENNICLEIFINLITSVHVPMFFCIAGYLCHKQDIKTYLNKKIHRIYIPFVLFTTLKLIYSTFIAQEFAHGTSLGQSILDAFLLGRLYWFAYAILLMYLMAPIFWKSREVNIAILICLVGINIFIGHPSINIFQIGRTFANVCFFLAGILIQQYECSLALFVKKNNKIILSICWMTLIIIVLLLKTSQLEITFFVKFILAFVQMYILYRVAKNMPPKIKVLKIIGKYSLQIMFFDSFFKVVLYSIANKFLPINGVTIVVIIAINITLACMSCVIISKIPIVKKLFGL